MHKYFDSRAQGTIEYLAILGVIIVISLVVVGLAMSSTSTTTISSTANKIGGLSSGSISVLETVVDTSGDGLISISNLSGDLMTVSKISLNGVDNNYSNVQLVSGNQRVFYLDELSTGCTCEGFVGQKRICDLVVYYESGSGLAKQFRYSINVDCVEETVAANPAVVVQPTGPLAYGINFRVYDSSNDSNLSGVGVDCNVNAYDATGVNSIFRIDFNVGSYSCDFNVASYDSNTGFSVVADSSKTYTVYLDPQLGLDFMEYDTNASLGIAYISNADFNDNFSGSLSNWTALSGSWGITSGALKKSNSGHNAIKVSSVSALNGTVEAKIYNNTANYNGIPFRIQNDNNYYFAVIHPDNGCDVRLVKKVNGAELDVNVAYNALPVCWPTVRDYNLKVTYYTEGAGIRVKIYLDDILKLDSLDSPAALPNAGSVGARAYYSNHSWDDFNFIGSLTKMPESTIKTQGAYSLKVIAGVTDSLDKNLTRTLASPINLTGKNNLKFDIRSNRTGSNIKIGLHDTGGTTTEVTPNITVADSWQAVDYDISGVSNANKDTIDKIIITIVNAGAENTFYIDNIIAS